eukprot:g6488.t1
MYFNGRYMFESSIGKPARKWLDRSHVSYSIKDSLDSSDDMRRLYKLSMERAKIMKYDDVMESTSGQQSKTLMKVEESNRSNLLFMTNSLEFRRYYSFMRDQETKSSGETKSYEVPKQKTSEKTRQRRLSGRLQPRETQNENDNKPRQRKISSTTGRDRFIRLSAEFNARQAAAESKLSTEKNRSPASPNSKTSSFKASKRHRRRSSAGKMLANMFSRKQKNDVIKEFVIPPVIAKIGILRKRQKLRWIQKTFRLDVDSDALTYFPLYRNGAYCDARNSIETNRFEGSYNLTKVKEVRQEGTRLLIVFKRKTSVLKGESEDEIFGWKAAIEHRLRLIKRIQREKLREGNGSDYEINENWVDEDSFSNCGSISQPESEEEAQSFWSRLRQRKRFFLLDKSPPAVAKAKVAKAAAAAARAAAGAAYEADADAREAMIEYNAARARENRKIHIADLDINKKPLVVTPQGGRQVSDLDGGKEKVEFRDDVECTPYVEADFAAGREDATEKVGKKCVGELVTQIADIYPSKIAKLEKERETQPIHSNQFDLELLRKGMAMPKIVEKKSCHSSKGCGFIGSSSSEIQVQKSCFIRKQPLFSCAQCCGFTGTFGEVERHEKYCGRANTHYSYTQCRLHQGK